MSNYLNFKAAKAAAKEAYEEKRVRPPEGTYTVRFLSARKEVSRNNNPMAVFDLKILKGNLAGKDLILRYTYVETNQYAWDEFGKLLDMFGLNSDTIDTEKKLLSALEAVSLAAPKGVVELSHQKNNTQYYNLKVVEVEPVSGGEDEEEELEEEPVKVKKAGAVKKAKPEPIEEEEESEEEAEEEDEGSAEEATPDFDSFFGGSKGKTKAARPY